MIGFLLKKFFFDLWDNLFKITLLNFGFLLSLALVLALPPLLPAGGTALFIALLYWLFVYICAAASVLKEVSDYRSPPLTEFIANIKKALLPAAVLFSVFVLVFFVLRVAVPVYLSMGNLPGTAAAFFTCWICLFALAAIQFYPAVYYRLGMRPLKSLKKCAVIFFDNTGFCFFVMAINILFIVPVFTCPCWSLLHADEALRLRIFKYDWLDAQAAEQHSSNGPYRKQRIPWDELLAEEKEKTGKRTVKSFLFPWKE